jgi:hypothetical protein
VAVARLPWAGRILTNKKPGRQIQPGGVRRAIKIKSPRQGVPEWPRLRAGIHVAAEVARVEDEREFDGFDDVHAPWHQASRRSAAILRSADKGQAEDATPGTS